MGRFPLVHAFGTALVDDALGIAQDHVVRPHAHGLEQFHTGDRRGAGAVHHQLGLAKLTTGQMAGIDQAGGGDDRGAMLVVVEHRDIHEFAQTLLDHEAFRRLDVFQVDPAEAGPEEADGVDEFVDVLGADLEIDTIDVGEALEQRDLAFHDGLGRDSAQVAETQDRRCRSRSPRPCCPWSCSRKPATGRGRCAGTVPRRPANKPATGRGPS